MRIRHSLLATLLACTASSGLANDYCVVVQNDTYADPGWKSVADVLVVKHNGLLLKYDSSPGEVLAVLKQHHPRHTCFVATPKQSTAAFVADVHQLTRNLDDDPYTDTLWGILTGYDAQNAFNIALHKEPLVIRKVASGTEIALKMCEEGLWYDELVKNKFVQKKKNGTAEQLQGPDDTTAALVETLNDYQPDLFVTSGHATEANWQIGFRYRNGFFKSSAGQMFGENTQKKRFEIDSTNPKVYLPIGNCLMGNINGPDAMALAWMNDVGVKQMMGYTVPTWFGYGGWGVLDYFVEQPGRYSLTEAFFANHQALLHSIETKAGNQRGLAFDRDVVAFYGDPKWDARMANAKPAYEQTLTVRDNVYTFTISPQRGSESFKPVNTNGAQRGWRPVVHWLPARLKDVKFISGVEFNPVVTDDFILVPNPRECDSSVKYQIVFSATEIE